jgi:hypothetical protein
MRARTGSSVNGDYDQSQKAYNYIGEIAKFERERDEVLWTDEDNSETRISCKTRDTIDYGYGYRKSERAWRGKRRKSWNLEDGLRRA